MAKVLKPKTLRKRVISHLDNVDLPENMKIKPVFQVLNLVLIVVLKEKLTNLKIIKISQRSVSYMYPKNVMYLFFKNQI